MTVCTASIFNWIYGEGDVGAATVVASDRMYTDEDLGIEYDSSRTKVAHIDQTHVVLVSGDLALNSRALHAIFKWRTENQDANTIQIASAYGSIISTLAFEVAAKIILNPLGIFTDEVLSDALGLKKYGLPNELVMRIAEQLQSEVLSCEAIIAGCDGRQAMLFRVDGKGKVTLHSDIGFLSIGTGGVHSTAYFMQLPYNHLVGVSEAIVPPSLLRSAPKSHRVSVARPICTSSVLIPHPRLRPMI